MLTLVRPVKSPADCGASSDAAKNISASQVASLRNNPCFSSLEQGCDTSGVLAGKNIRLLLKAKFNSVKFSVRKTSYGTLAVEWTDGPTPDEVDAVIGLFRRGSFDGMEDIYVSNGSAWCEVFGGVSYLSINRNLSDQLVERVIAVVLQKHGSELAAVQFDSAVEDFQEGRLFYVDVASEDCTLQSLISKTASNISLVA